MPSYHIYFIKIDSLGNSGCNEGNMSPLVLPASVSLSIEQVTIGAYGNARPMALQTSRGGTVNLFCYTGQKEVEETFSVSVFPNPFHTNTTLQLNSNPSHLADEMKFDLYNALGHKVSSLPVIGAQTTLHRDNLHAGIYYYRVSNSTRVFSCGKLIIE